MNSIDTLNPRRLAHRLGYAGLPAGPLGAEGGDDVLVERSLTEGSLVAGQARDDGEGSGQARDDG